MDTQGVENNALVTPTNEPPYAPCVPAMLKHLASQWSERELIVQDQRRVSFSDLDIETSLLARGLLDRGVGKGTRVGLLMPNTPEWALAFFAITRIGAVAVPLSTLYQPPELSSAIKHADLTYVVTAERYLRHNYVDKLEVAFPELLGCLSPELRISAAPYLRGIFVWDSCEKLWPMSWPDAVLLGTRASEEALAAAEAAVVPADEMFVLYTSGSTAEPKAVVHEQGSAIRHAYTLSTHGTPLRQGDRIATARPFFWVAGLVATLLYSLQSGVTIVCTRSNKVEDVLDAIESEGITAVTGREAFMSGLFDEIAGLGSRYGGRRLSYDHTAITIEDPDSPVGVRYVNPRFEMVRPIALEPVPPELFPRSYGMTETLGTALTELDVFELPVDKPWSSGRPVPGLTVRVVDPVSRQDVRPGQAGELLVRGCTVMSGMHKKERADVFEEEGFYSTGDLVSFDEDGYFFVRGRLGEMLKIKGANVAPAEVERWMMAIDGVVEAVVLAVERNEPEDPVLVGVAIGKHKDSQRDAEVIDYLRMKLSSFKVPKRIVWLAQEDVPRTGSGKIVRRELVKLIERQLGC